MGLKAAIEALKNNNGFYDASALDIIYKDAVYVIESVMNEVSWYG